MSEYLPNLGYITQCLNTIIAPYQAAKSTNDNPLVRPIDKDCWPELHTDECAATWSFYFSMSNLSSGVGKFRYISSEAANITTSLDSMWLQEGVTTPLTQDAIQRVDLEKPHYQALFNNLNLLTNNPDEALDTLENALKEYYPHIG